MMQLVLDPATSLFTHALATNDFPHLAPALVDAHRGSPCIFSPVPSDILHAYPTVEALSQDDAVQVKAGIADVATTEICIVELDHAAKKHRSMRKEQRHTPWQDCQISARLRGAANTRSHRCCLKRLGPFRRPLKSQRRIHTRGQIKTRIISSVIKKSFKRDEL